MNVVYLIGQAIAADPHDPDLVVDSSCELQGSGLVDLDGDAVEDLVLQVGGALYVWTTLAPSVEPWSWWTEVNEDSDVPLRARGWFSLAPPSASSSALVVRQSDGTSEYSVDPESGALAFRWSGAEFFKLDYFGDLDGDGLYDLVSNNDVRYSASGSWSKLVPHPYGTPVGDVDGDGYDDIVMGTLDGEFYKTEKCSWAWGPAHLHRGTPDGVNPTSTWTVDPPVDPKTGVGRLAARLPGRDAIVMTVVPEGLLCLFGDWGPGSLAVVHDVSTAAPTVTQIVPVTTKTVNWLMPGLRGTYRGEVLLLEEAAMQWFPWDPVSGKLAEAPVVWGALGVTFTQGLWSFRDPTGSEVNAFTLVAREPTGSAAVYVWGRTLENYGLGREPWSDGACTFSARSFGDPPPVFEATDAVDSGSDTATDVDTPRCGCEAPGQVPWVWLVGLVFATRLRRTPRAPS